MTEASVFQLVYVSSTVGLLTKDALLEILDHSRKNNARLEVTGLLLYRDGNVMQVLEGAREAVQPLFEKIAQDPRHTGIITLMQGMVPAREFSEWAMGFRDLRSPELREHPGYSEFMNTPLDASVSAARAQQLLRIFRSRM